MIGNIGGQKPITGDTLTVTTPGAGITVTVSKDGKSKTKVSGADGVVAFKGLEAGAWTVNCTDGEQTSVPRTVEVTTDYSISITFFSATINVTYPAGSVCTATDGVTTLTAPDTSGSWECTVPNAGTWTVTATDGSKSNSAAVTITTDGQTASVTLSYTVSLYDHGDTCDSVTGGWEAVYPHYCSNGTTFGTDRVTLIPGGSGSVRTAALTKNKIDLTPYSKIYVHHVSTIKRPGNYTCQRIDLLDQKDITGTPIAYVSENRTENDWIQVLDVSEINTTCYVGIQCNGSSTESNLPKIVFDAVWMELR